MLNASADSEFEASFRHDDAQERPDALLVPTTPYFFSRRAQLSRWWAQLALPAIYEPPPVRRRRRPDELWDGADGRLWPGG